MALDHPTVETLFKVERAFTETYQRYRDAHPALREAHCLEVQYPAIGLPIGPEDRFAGRMNYRAVGFSPQYWRSGGSDDMGYYCDAALIRQQMDQYQLAPEERAQMESLIAFWEEESTAARIHRAWTPAMSAAMQFGVDLARVPVVIAPLYRLAGANVDFDKLLRLGLPGLRAEIVGRLTQAEAAGAETALFEGMLITLDVLVRSALYYAEQACALGEQEPDPVRRADLQTMAAVLVNITQSAPSTLREAIQLVYLYTTHTMLAANYGRMDVYLGDFYVGDREAGCITEAEALDLVVSFWRMMRMHPAHDRVNIDTRVIVGGRGRRNEPHADRFALLAMEASSRVCQSYPQLSLRFYAGQNPALYERALTLLSEGLTFPILYNDDVNIPAVAQAFGIEEELAAQYVPFGCGEYVIDHASYGTPNAVINLAKTLEITLRNGHDALTAEQVGLASGRLADFATFEQLWDAYDRQVRHFTALAAELQALTYRAAGEQAPFLFLSMLYDDCIAHGAGMFAGGLRHLGGTYETYGNITTADSLTAIQMLVYGQGEIAPETLLDALDADFDGYDALRRKLLNAPKFGSDDDRADGMAARVHSQVCAVTQAQAARVGLDSYLVVVINNSMHVTFGAVTEASADGRKRGEPLTNGHTATNGMERQGITALLNSMVKLDPTCHAGATHNLKLSRSLFTTYRPQLEALLSVYWAQGGTQAMITVVSREDLLNALREPEKYGHLMVRVGGFSARFVDLAPDIQQEIINRTLWV